MLSITSDMVKRSRHESVEFMRDNDGNVIPVTYKDINFTDYAWSNDDSQCNTIVRRDTLQPITPYKRANVYYYVILSRKGEKRKGISLHGLKAYSFLGPPPPPGPDGKVYDSVDHIDRDPNNNHISNLRHATRLEQVYNQSRQPERKNSQRPIQCTDSEGLVKVYSSLNIAVETIKPDDTITLNTKLWHARNAIKSKKVLWGHLFEFAPPPPGEWKPIKKYPGFKVGDNGFIMRPSGQWVSGTLTWDKYYYININDKKIGVHVLVAEVFVVNPQPQKYNMVNHIDGNKKNNCKENLEWTDRVGNGHHAARTGLNNSCKAVVATCLKTGTVKQFFSVHEAARVLKSCNQNVFACLVGKRNKAAEHTFTYA